MLPVVILTICRVGGSIRVPAAFNNHYGIRPSHGRLPYAKMANSMEGQETIHSVVGPMCHSIEDMRLFMTAVLQEQPWDYDSRLCPCLGAQLRRTLLGRSSRLGACRWGFSTAMGM